MSLAEKYFRGDSEIKGLILLIERDSVKFSTGTFFGLNNERYVSSFSFILYNEATKERFDGEADYYTVQTSETTPDAIDYAAGVLGRKGSAASGMIATALSGLPSLQGPGYYVRGTQKRIHKNPILPAQIPPRG